MIFVGVQHYYYTTIIIIIIINYTTIYIITINVIFQIKIL